MTDFISENFRDLVVLAALGGGFIHFTDAQLPSLPHWWGLAALGAVAVIIAALFASGKIDDLIPDPPKVHLLVINAADTSVVEQYELSPDYFSELEVVAGTLNELEESKERAYEAYHYDPEQNVAVGTWRESRPASEIVGNHEVSQALDEISELRTHLEPMARKGRYIRRYLPSIVRELDRKRMEAQNSALEEHVAPSFGADGIDDVIQGHVPDDLRPERLREQDAERAEQGGQGETYGFDLLDDTEALEPMNPTNGESHESG